MSSLHLARQVITVLFLSSGVRRRYRRQERLNVMSPAFEKAARHSKRKKAHWRAFVRCEWKEPSLSSLSGHPRGADSWKESRLRLSFPELALRESRRRCRQPGQGSPES